MELVTTTSFFELIPDDSMNLFNVKGLDDVVLSLYFAKANQPITSLTACS